MRGMKVPEVMRLLLRSVSSRLNIGVKTIENTNITIELIVHREWGEPLITREQIVWLNVKKSSQVEETDLEHEFHEQKQKSKRIVIKAKKDGKLPGFCIRGGVEFGTGIFVSR